MSSITKTPDLAKSYFNEDKYLESLRSLETVDLELLLDWYILYAEAVFCDQKRLIKIELEARNTPLWKELFE